MYIRQLSIQGPCAPLNYFNIYGLPTATLPKRHSPRYQPLVKTLFRSPGTIDVDVVTMATGVDVVDVTMATVTSAECLWCACDWAGEDLWEADTVVTELRFCALALCVARMPVFTSGIPVLTLILVVAVVAAAVAVAAVVVGELMSAELVMLKDTNNTDLLFDIIITAQGVSPGHGVGTETKGKVVLKIWFWAKKVKPVACSLFPFWQQLLLFRIFLRMKYLQLKHTKTDRSSYLAWAADAVDTVLVVLVDWLCNSHLAESFIWNTRKIPTAAYDYWQSISTAALYTAMAPQAGGGTGTARAGHLHFNWCSLSLSCLALLCFVHSQPLL